MNDNQTYEFYSPPEPVGYWRLYDGAAPFTQFPMFKKPTDEQVKNTEQLLGWKWVDAS